MYIVVQHCDAVKQYHTPYHGEDSSYKAWPDTKLAHLPYKTL